MRLQTRSRGFTRGCARGCLYTCLVVTGCHVYEEQLVAAPQRANAASTVRDCAEHSEACDGEDDDCDGVIDEGAAAQCELANAASRCSAGSCAIGHCAEGYFDCNGLAADGCETAEEQRACGACGRLCMPAQAAAAMPEPAAAPAADRDAAAAREPMPPAAANPPDADAGEAIDSCQPQLDVCNGRDDDCDGRVDEAGNCACTALLGPGDWPDIAYTPTGQGAACDRCACEQCSAGMLACLVRDDSDWSRRCSALLQCYGRNSGDARCASGDCYQGGSGPCASDVRAALFGSGISCSTERIDSPCGAATALRDTCLKTACAAVCKF